MKLRLKTTTRIAVAAGLLALTGCIQTAAIEDTKPLPPRTEVTTKPTIRLDEPLIDPQGIAHEDCYVTVAEPSSTVECADGYTEQS